MEQKVFLLTSDTFKHPVPFDEMPVIVFAVFSFAVIDVYDYAWSSKLLQLDFYAFYQAVT